MAVLYTNNAATTLASSITAAATSLTVTSGKGALFPAPVSPSYFYATLSNSDGSVMEIVKVTARTTDTFTVTRAQDGTTAVAWNAGEKFELRITKGMLDDFKLDTQAGITSSNVTTALGYTPYNSTNPNGYISGNQSITVSGDASGTGATAISLTLTSVGTAGTYTKVTTDAKGRVTSGTTLTSADLPTYTGTLTSSQVTTALGYTPLSNATSYLPLSGGTVGGTLTINGGDGLRVFRDGGASITSHLYFANAGNNRAYNWQLDESSNAALWGYGGSAWAKLLTVTSGGAFNAVGAITQAGNQVLHAGNYTSYRGTQLYSPNGATVVSADTASAMPDTGQSFIHTLGYGPTNNDGHILGMSWANSTTTYGAQIWLDTDPTSRMAIRSRSGAGVWNSWSEVVTANNYNNYSPTLTGTGASGTWGISITGSAASITGTYGGTLTSSQVTTALGYTPYNSTNPSGYISGITSGMVTTALGYTPYNSTNPNGYITSSGSISGSAGSVAVHSSNEVNVGGSYSGGGRLYVNYNDGGSFSEYGFYNGGTSLAGIAASTGSFSGAITQAGNQVLHAGNYNSYAPTLTGTGASGTWGISITGNAANITGTYGGTLTSSQVTTALGYTPYNSTNPNGYITSSSLSSYLPLSGGTLTGATTIQNAMWTFKNTATGGTQRGLWTVYDVNNQLRAQFGLETTNWPILWTYNTAGTYSGSYQFNGGDFIASGNVTAYSDERAKENWRDLPENFIESLSQVKHGVYDRTDAKITQVGVSAQSLRQVLENAVVEDEDGKLSVAYGNAALVAAIKLAERVVELEARLNVLETKQ